MHVTSLSWWITGGLSVGMCVRKQTRAQQHPPMAAEGEHLETMAGLSGCRLHPAAVGASARVCRGIKKSIKIQRMPPPHSGSSPFVCQRMEARDRTMASVPPERQTGNRLITMIPKNKSRSLRFELNINNNHKSSRNLE